MGLVALLYVLPSRNYVPPSRSSVPLVVDTVLKEFYDVFPKGLPIGLPHLRDIQHHIDHVPNGVLPNHPHYRAPKSMTSYVVKLKNFLVKDKFAKVF